MSATYTIPLELSPLTVGKATILDSYNSKQEETTIIIWEEAHPLEKLPALLHFFDWMGDIHLMDVSIKKKCGYKNLRASVLVRSISFGVTVVCPKQT